METTTLRNRRHFKGNGAFVLYIEGARLRANWDETAAVLAHLTNTANAFAGVKSAVNPADLNPYRREAQKAETATVIDRHEAIEIFKALAGGK